MRFAVVQFFKIVFVCSVIAIFPMFVAESKYSDWEVWFFFFCSLFLFMLFLWALDIVRCYSLKSPFQVNYFSVHQNVVLQSSLSTEKIIQSSLEELNNRSHNLIKAKRVNARTIRVRSKNFFQYDVKISKNGNDLNLNCSPNSNYVILGSYYPVEILSLIIKKLEKESV